MRMRFILTTILVMIALLDGRRAGAFATLARPTSTTSTDRGPVAGDGTYTNSKWGYALTYDGTWSVVGPSPAADADVFAVTNGTSQVAFAAQSAGDTNAKACVESVISLLAQSSAATDLSPVAGSAGGDANRAWAVVESVNADAAADRERTAYVECRVLVPDLTRLIILHDVSRRAYGGEVAVREALLAGLVLPTPVMTVPRPNYVAGTITDARGQPIRGGTAWVAITHSIMSSRTFRTTADADGHYELELPLGTYRVSAYVDVTYTGKRYEFELDPVDGNAHESYSSREGIVKDFHWKISGPTPDFSDGRYPGDYYGGSILIDDGFFDDESLAVRYSDDIRILLTLRPRGALIDGTTGQDLEVELNLYGHTVGDALDGAILDVPIGAYTATARLVAPDGRERPLVLARAFTGNVLRYQNTLDVDFGPESTGINQFAMFVTDSA